jgi:hypothetical protein
LCFFDLTSFLELSLILYSTRGNYAGGKESDLLKIIIKGFSNLILQNHLILYSFHQDICFGWREEYYVSDPQEVDI